ncbi:MAG: OmpA family protein [Bacteroidetes bacterium]|nr:OmpA family protein [Bacteroidota bacterium]
MKGEMRKRIGLFALLFLAVFPALFAQEVEVEGYAFEEDNRGYLNEVYVVIIEKYSLDTVFQDYTASDGHFALSLPANQSFELQAFKRVFQNFSTVFTTNLPEGKRKVFLELRMEREPGYWLEVTLAEEYQEDGTAESITDARIEVYNLTDDKEELVLEKHPYPTFSHTLEQGKQYTIMIRKEGYFTRRIEAYVNVDGCILCIDGISDLAPGVSDNLTAGNELGTLLANIEMTSASLDKTLVIQNIYYDYDKWDIRPDAAYELDKVSTLLKENPNLIIELGSHTDSRGKDKYNLDLSQKRAESAVNYILSSSEIGAGRISARGYGESQLVNDCTNGVKCSEDEHQENRRTELKIIGFSDYNAGDVIPLSEIIRQEKFDKLLEEIQNQEVIQIREGEELPEEIRKDLEKKENDQ